MVILLVAIVSAVAITQFVDFRKDAKTAVTNERINTIRLAIIGDPRTNRSGYISHFGVVPANLTALAVQGAQANFDPIAKRGWAGPYIDSSLSYWSQDAWGTNLVYSSSLRTITSCGPNLTCGNADDIVVTF